MGDRSGMSISADSPSDETLNWGPLVLLLRRQYEFPFALIIVQFSISVYSPLDDNLNRGSLALLLRQQYEFPFGINVKQFSISNFSLTQFESSQIEAGHFAWFPSVEQTAENDDVKAHFFLENVMIANGVEHFSEAQCVKRPSWYDVGDCCGILLVDGHS